jgi:hypothetical protein
VQDSIGSDKELEVPPSSQAAVAYTLEQIPPKIWMALKLEAIKWLLDDQTLQQQEDDTSRKLSFLSRKDTIKSRGRDDIC